MTFINLDDYLKEALKQLKKGELKEAQEKFNYLINVEPDNPYALYGLGSYYAKIENYGMSILCYEKSLQLVPEMSELWNNLAGMYRKMGYNEKARKSFLKAIKLTTSKKFKEEHSKEEGLKLKSDYYANFGSSFVADNQAEQAIKILNKSLKIHPDSSNAKWNKSLALLELGRYEEGFNHYDFGNRVDEAHSRIYTPADPRPVWDGSPDKTVVVYGEQGIGDEIMLASILPDMIKDCKKVIFDAHERLIYLFRQAFPEIDVYGTRKHGALEWSHNYDIDAQIHIGSIPKFYRNKKEDFPGEVYLASDVKLLPKIMEKMKNLPLKKSIGISWKGGTQSTNKSARSIELKQFIPLMKAFPEYNFISLQYQKHTNEEVDKFNEKHIEEGIYLYHWQNIIDDYDLTAVLLEQLDYIVSVPQSVVHLAGAMGIETYQLCPVQHLWQMGVYGEDMPWYASVKNIWQDNPHEWDKCINTTIEKLKGDLEC